MCRVHLSLRGKWTFEPSLLRSQPEVGSEDLEFRARNSISSTPEETLDSTVTTEWDKSNDTT